MKKIGIYFGTDTGTTRLMAKKMAKKMGGIAQKPLNVNRTEVEDFLKHDAFILGTPTYGINQLPGKSTDIEAGSWEEFLPRIENIDFSGKTIALYGLGDQAKYADRFLDSMVFLYRFFSERGATIIGQWPVEGYSFEQSQAVIDGKFVGLALDQQNQAILTEARIDQWLDQITAKLVAAA